MSPTRAVILSGHPIYQGTHRKVLDLFRMVYFNQTIELAAYEQLFGGTEDTLKALVLTFCAKLRAV